MKRRLLPAALTTFALAAGGAESLASDRLSLKVTPNVSNAPSTVIVTATVAKDAANRLLRVEADSGSFYRSSTIELDGDKAPSVTEFRFNSLPSGTYSVIAVLSDNAGDQTVARRQVIVLSRFGEEP